MPFSGQGDKYLPRRFGLESFKMVEILNYSSNSFVLACYYFLKKIS